MGLLKLDTASAFEESSEDVVRVVVCGEVNSGKSTVLNGLLRQKALPDFFGTAERPLIVVSQGEAARYGVVRGDGKDETVETLQDCDLSDTSMCKVVTEYDHLAGFEIVEVPYLNEKDVPDDVIQLVASADILIWMTIASQAWRLSEKTILDKLENRPKRAVLAVSRADKLRNDDDRGRMRDRLARETPDYFEEIVFFHGASKSIENSAENDEAWQATAAPELLEVLENMSKSVFEDREASGNGVGAPVAEAEAPPKETVEETTNVVALPVTPRAAEPKPAANERPEPTLISRKSTDALMTVLEATHGCLAMGVVSASDSGKFDLLHGSDVAWEAMGQYCAKTIEALSETEQGHVNEAMNSHVSTRTHQILMQSFPRADICLFMVAASERMNASIARMAFTRLCKAYEMSAK